MKALIKSVLPESITSRFFKPVEPVHQDSISDSLAIWEICWGDDEYFKSLMELNAGIWSCREFCAAKILPTVRHYYFLYGEDWDFDAGFLPVILKAMYINNWNMEHDYSAVCEQGANDWWS